MTTLACLFCFTACANFETPDLPADSATPDFTVTPTATATHTPTITLTLTPTITPTPTVTATPILPVFLPSQFPYPSTTISQMKVTSVRELAKFGTPHKRFHTVSSDGKRGFLLTTEGVTAYEMETGKVIGQYSAILCLDRTMYCEDGFSLSSDGNRFAIISLFTIQVWDLTLGLILEIPRTGVPETVALSPDGKVLLLGGGEKVEFISVDTAANLELQPTIYGDRFLFSPDQTVLLVWRPGLSVSVIDIATWKMVMERNLLAGQDFRAFSDDGKLLVSQGAKTLDILVVDTWRIKRSIPIPDDKSHSTYNIQFSSDNQQVTLWRSVFTVRTLTTQNLIEVYDISTGELLDSQEVAEFPVSKTIPDGVCQTAGFATSTECNTNPLFFQSRLSYQDSTGRIGVISSDPYGDPPISSICLVTPGLSQDCAEVNYLVFFGQDQEPYSAVKDETGQFVSIYPGVGSESGPLGTIPIHADMIDPLWLSSDRRLFLVYSSTHISGFSFSSKIELWDLKDQTRLKKWDVFRWYYSQVSQDGKYLVLNLSNYKVVYDLVTLRAVTQVNQRTFNQSAFTHRGDRLIAVGEPKSDTPWSTKQFRFTITDLNTLQTSSGPLVIHEQFERGIEGIALSPDDRLLAVGMSDGVILIYSMETNELLHQWQAHFGNITQLEFSEDGRLLISNSQGGQNNGDGFVRVWGIWP
jgi:WD40 repeat protein